MSAQEEQDRLVIAAPIFQTPTLWLNSEDIPKDARHYEVVTVHCYRELQAEVTRLTQEKESDAWHRGWQEAVRRMQESERNNVQLAEENRQLAQENEQLRRDAESGRTPFNLTEVGDGLVKCISELTQQNEAAKCRYEDSERGRDVAEEEIWNDVLRSVLRAWETPPEYLNSPLELVSALIEERDNVAQENERLKAEVARVTLANEILEQVLKEEREELKHHIEENERLKAAAVSTATKLDGHPPCRVCGSREHCYSARCRG